MSTLTQTKITTTDMLHISVWTDPLVDRLGHDPRSNYVEQYWLGILGPSLVWIPSTLAFASSGVGHGASVFTNVLLACQFHRCGLAGSLRHVTGFPGLGLLRTLRPIPGPSADGEPARRPAGCWPGWATPRWFPRSPCVGRRDRRPALPLQPRSHLRRRPSVRASLPTSAVGIGVADRIRSGQRALSPGPHPPGWSRFHT